jgi:hypothetical protein
MIRMKAPEGHTSFAYGGVEYPVIAGAVEVAPGHVRAALSLGYKLSTAHNADGQARLDLEGAIAKAEAPLQLMKAPVGIVSVVVEGEQFDVVDGHVAVPVGIVDRLRRQGFELGVDVPKGARKADDRRKGA